MTNTTSNVIAGAPLLTGAAFAAPKGTALPTDETTALNAAFNSLGYVSEDGLTEAMERSTENILDWGGRTVKVVQTEFASTITLTMIEGLNAEVLKAVYGDSQVTTTAATAVAGTKHAVAVTSDPLAHKSWVFEIKDGDARMRLVVPDGQITETGEITYTQSSVVGYEVTITAFPDSSGNFIYKYTDDGVVDAA